MYKICRTEKSFARQRELEEGLQNYMEEVPFFEMEITNLCRYLKIPRKTFYRYFGSKEDALYALIDHRLMDMNQYMDKAYPGNQASLHDEFVCFFSFWKQQLRFLDVLDRNYLSSVLMNRAVLPQNRILRVAEYSGMTNGTGREYAATFLMTGVMSVMYSWYLGGYRDSAEEIAKTVEIMFSVPIRSFLNYK